MKRNDSSEQEYDSSSSGDEDDEESGDDKEERKATIPSPGTDAPTAISTASKKGKGGSAAAATSEERWNEMFCRLENFKKKHGHTNVPNRYGPDSQLGCWVSAVERS